MNMPQNQRNIQRVSVTLPIQLIFGTQITLKGQVKDLSLKSAFVIVKASIYMAPNDELSFIIESLPDNPDGRIQGLARISRIAPGEGIAIYFTKIDDASTICLQKLVSSNVQN